MIRLLWLILMLPVWVMAQTSFGPTRLDDGEGEYFYYPTVRVINNDTVRCTWSSTSQSRIAALGRYSAADGELLGEPYPYQDVTPMELTCPARLFLAPLSTGGEARLLFHS